MKKYVLHYVEGCTPKVKIFDTKLKLTRFCKKFKRDYRDNKEDNWLDYFLEGSNIQFNSIDSYWEDLVK